MEMSIGSPIVSSFLSPGMAKGTSDVSTADSETMCAVGHHLALTNAFHIHQAVELPRLNRLAMLRFCHPQRIHFHHPFMQMEI